MLVELTGIAVFTDEAAHIKALYNALDSFDKKIVIMLKSLSELRGQFCRHRKTVHSHSELMARFILMLFFYQFFLSFPRIVQSRTEGNIIL